MNNPTAYDDDSSLFRRIASGDETAFRQVFERYTPKLHPFVLGIVKNEDIAKELIQDIFLQLWIKRENLAQIEKPSSWLYRMASNRAINHFRRQQLEQRILETSYSAKPEASSEQEELFNAKELQQLIHEATRQLPEQRKRIFNMSRDKGLSRKEIAAELGISENTVKNQLVFALKSIQDYIQKTSGFYIPAFFLVQAMHP